MTDRRQLDELKLLAERRVMDVLGACGVKGKPKGQKGYLLIEAPDRRQDSPSFCLYTRGGLIGFHDFASGESGDILATVAALKGWRHLPHGGFLEAKRFLEDYLGLKAMTPEQRAADARRAAARRDRDERDAARELIKNIGRAQEIFYQAQPFAGTLAEVYLRRRGIAFDLLPRGPRGGERRPGALRFLPNEQHICDVRGHEHFGRVTFWPCMVACCVDPATGEVRALHRTWLDAAFVGNKAPVVPVRKSWPAVGGLVIPVWKGASWLSVREAAAVGLRETVVLAEGIETALSAVLADPQYRTWAVIALGNLARLVLPDCIDSVMVSRENDWVKPQAVAMFEAGKRALERGRPGSPGRPVAEIRAFGGNDLNDVLRGDEPAGRVSAADMQQTEGAA